MKEKEWDFKNSKTNESCTWTQTIIIFCCWRKTGRQGASVLKSCFWKYLYQETPFLEVGDPFQKFLKRVGVFFTSQGLKYSVSHLDDTWFGHKRKVLHKKEKKKVMKYFLPPNSLAGLWFFRECLKNFLEVCDFLFLSFL